MDAKYQDLHICRNGYFEIGIVKRGIKLDSIQFCDECILITYRDNGIKYTMQIPYTELERKSITID